MRRLKQSASSKHIPEAGCHLASHTLSDGLQMLEQVKDQAGGFQLHATGMHQCTPLTGPGDRGPATMAVRATGLVQYIFSKDRSPVGGRLQLFYDKWCCITSDHNIVNLSLAKQLSPRALKPPPLCRCQSTPLRRASTSSAQLHLLPSSPSALRGWAWHTSKAAYSHTGPLSGCLRQE